MAAKQTFNAPRLCRTAYSVAQWGLLDASTVRHARSQAFRGLVHRNSIRFSHTKNPLAEQTKGFRIRLTVTYPDLSGAEGIRTPGLLNAIQALSQLSYSPYSTKA